jgi:hypothetical protein
MPIEGIDTLPRRERNLVVYDNRPAQTVNNVKIGFCGFAILRFEGNVLTASYEDERGDVLLQERWVTGPEGEKGELLDVRADFLNLVQPVEVLVS